MSDGFVSAQVTDPSFVDPWGVSGGKTLWIDTAVTGFSYVTSIAGVISFKAIVPPASGTSTGQPTGTVQNSTASGFVLSNGLKASFLFASLDGVITGWNSAQSAGGNHALVAINNSLQPFIAAFYRWKQNNRPRQQEPILFDFTSFEPLKKSAELFYQTGLTPHECIKTLKRQMANVEKMARFIVAYIYSIVLGDESVLTLKHLAEAINIEQLEFNPDKMRETGQGLDHAQESQFGKAGADFVAQFRRATEGPEPHSVARHRG